MTMPGLTMLSVLTMAAMAAPAMAGPVATARLVSCDAGDCLLVRGHRDARQAAIRINGRPVEATGGGAWRVELPVATVRDWSAFNARTLHVAVDEPGATTDHDFTVRLPVGMLARAVELASLVVRAR